MKKVMLFAVLSILILLSTQFFSTVESKVVEDYLNNELIEIRVDYFDLITLIYMKLMNN